MAAAVPAVEAARQCRVEAVPPDLIKPLLALVEFKQTLGLEELSPETFAEYYSATEAYVNYHAASSTSNPSRHSFGSTQSRPHSSATPLTQCSDVSALQDPVALAEVPHETPIPVIQTPGIIQTRTTRQSNGIYLCLVCTRQYTRMAQLKKHTRADHNSETRYKCTDCDVVTTTAACMELHCKEAKKTDSNHRHGYWSLPGKVAYGCPLCGDRCAPSFDKFMEHISRHFNNGATDRGLPNVRLQSLLHQDHVQLAIQRQCFRRKLSIDAWKSLTWDDANADWFSERLEFGRFDEHDEFRQHGYVNLDSFIDQLMQNCMNLGNGVAMPGQAVIQSRNMPMRAVQSTQHDSMSPSNALYASDEQAAPHPAGTAMHQDYQFPTRNEHEVMAVVPSTIPDEPVQQSHRQAPSHRKHMPSLDSSSHPESVARARQGPAQSGPAQSDSVQLGPAQSGDFNFDFSPNAHGAGITLLENGSSEMNDDEWLGPLLSQPQYPYNAI